MREATHLKVYKLLLAAFLTASLLCNLVILWGKWPYAMKGHFDFVIYYTGAEIVNAGQGSDLYNLKVQKSYQKKFEVPGQPWPVLPFNHAPYELLLFLPLAALPFPTAHIIWSLLSVTFLFIAWQILLPFIDRRQKYLVAALFASFYPTMTALQMGQDSTLSLLILMGVYTLLKRNKDLWAGGILALGLYKPQLVLPLAGILAFRGYWRAVLGFVASATILGGISLTLVGWKGAWGLLQIVTAMDEPTSIVYPESMPNLRGLFYLIFDLIDLPPSINAITFLGSIAVYTYFIYSWREKTEQPSETFDLHYSFGIIVTILISYHLYPHDLLILLIPITLLLTSVTDRGQLSALLGVLICFMPFVPFYLTIKGGFGWVVLPVILMGASIIYGMPSPAALNRLTTNHG